MIIQVDKTGTLQEFKSILDKTIQNENVEGLLILTCDENGFEPDNIDEILQNVPIPLFGGIFPAIVHNSEKRQKGTIVAGLSKKPDVHVIPELSDPNIDYEEALDEIFTEAGDDMTMFVFVDGYSRNLSSLIESMYDVFGLKFNYVGGGAGSINPSALDMSNTYCLLTNDGLVKDSAILALVDIKSSIGVNHGWQKISGPYRVTESKGNSIISLDWKPAFEVYKEIIKEHSGITLTHEKFFDIAKRFPFGISRMESEIIVRDPFTVDDNSLIVATEIPQESSVDILTGNSDSIVEAAKKSYAEAVDNSPRGREKTIFLIDCISRILFLGDDYDREITAVAQDDYPLIGALSLGEIANSGGDYMELYNKTCVVGILGE